MSHDDLTDRHQFLNMAGVMEGGLVLVALLLGWIADPDINPVASIRFHWQAVAWGLLATVPIFLLFLLAYRFPVGPFLPIKRFLIEMLGPSLVACRWYDLVLLALLAGVSEEILFRGVIQPWMGRVGFVVGLIGSNLLFGMAHAITPAYAVLAAVMGAYLGLLPYAASLDLLPGDEADANLLIPVITHAVYDYLAFLVIARTSRLEGRLPALDDSADPDGRAEVSEDD